jgi:hypothetical protein
MLTPNRKTLLQDDPFKVFYEQDIYELLSLEIERLSLDRHVWVSYAFYYYYLLSTNPCLFVSFDRDIQGAGDL